MLCWLLPLCAAQRAIHWVIRTSSLEDSLNFTQEVLGMKVTGSAPSRKDSALLKAYLRIPFVRNPQ